MFICIQKLLTRCGVNLERVNLFLMIIRRACFLMIVMLTEIPKLCKRDWFRCRFLSDSLNIQNSRSCHRRIFRVSLTDGCTLCSKPVPRSVSQIELATASTAMLYLILASILSYQLKTRKGKTYWTISILICLLTIQGGRHKKFTQYFTTFGNIVEAQLTGPQINRHRSIRRPSSIAVQLHTRLRKL